MGVTVEHLSAAFGKPLDAVFAERLAQVFTSPVTEAGADGLTFADGSTVPVVNHVPRFVPSDAYVKSFSFQWTQYQQTQHDSLRNSGFSKSDVTHKTGLTPDQVAGKLVLDAGCGTGRIAELLAEWGAMVIGADLSLSVDVAQKSLEHFNTAAVIQADIGALPFAPGSFDFVISCGVLHHTPDTRDYTRRLVSLVKPGGELAIWVYSPRLARRQDWIPLTSRLPHVAFNDWCQWIVGPARQDPDNHLLRLLYPVFPFTARHETRDWSALTLFDGYTPTYHGVHSEEEVIDWFTDFGFVDIRRNPVATAIRGRKPG
ncbi:class I SAM-dependent methyltransferase [Ferrovibrio xuzhouensis]|uniref:Class I SAM-dependent methyltransferase n=1 Tax=Ferrovibrio xuzhouensis TaxID=1576914 RepID=A0ABV7VII4_9PROT